MDREKEFNRLYALLDKITEQQDERQRKIDEKLDKMTEQQDERQRKIDEKLDKMTEQQNERQRKIDETLDRVGKNLDRIGEDLDKMKERQEKMDERLGNMGVNIGHRAEDYFFNSLAEAKTFGGVQYDDIQRNVGGRVHGVQDEFDIVLYNGDSIALIETKHKAHPKDVEQLISRKLPNFKKLFPVYGGYKVYLGIATEALSEEVKTKSIENGIGLLVPQGDVIEILDEGLKAY